MDPHPPAPDGALFARLLITHERQMRTLVRSMIPGCRDVDEIIQDASVAMWKKFHEYDAHRPFGPWALTFARFQSLAYLERRKRTAARLSDESLEKIADCAASDARSWDGRESDRQVALDECMAKLTPKETRLLGRRYGDGLTVTEIAESGEFRGSREALYKTYARLSRRLLDCVRLKGDSIN
ncbi:MAG: sigma-70 family RNA polymerase sigma factor [Opitutales bacterium]|jgi:RNA polymerase sigma-70 factor, ECF subfamily|nr:sigma-70 family RNA polymerase sigma factor [Opitutales bacterium]MBT5167950.1 sigma-70 family RNA polymerase sigma factor [Opitutales bacterium]MBT5813685.1 sigma-70 family RNA polymerase sigma factor [Opitutales bacterium]MBT6770444.1 sigma-70 family RNA polymerase sigma factor [Opitutales bacterium]